jgi:DNA-directed RNA polymerase beta subunit
MKQSPHQYPLFSDLIEAQKKSVLSFFEKGILEEFELFSYVQGKNIAMIFHGSKFFLQKPLFSFEYLVESQKTYSVSLFIPVEFQAWKGIGSSVFGQPSDRKGIASVLAAQTMPKAGEGQSPRASGQASVPLLSRAEPSATNIHATQNVVDPSVTLERSLRVGEGVSASRERSYAYGERSAGFASTNAAGPLDKNFARRLAPWIYCGEIPFMTERGNFLINGSARVLVNQIVRCPSVYFKVRIDQKNRRTYIGSFLSEYGSWLRLETDYKNRLWVRIDKSERFSIYALLRALGFPETFLKYQLKYYSFLFASQDEYNESRTRTRGVAQAQLRSAGAKPAPMESRGLERGETATNARATQMQGQSQRLQGRSHAKPAPTLYPNIPEQASLLEMANLPSEKVEEYSQQYQFHPKDSKSSSFQLTPHTAVQSIWKKCNPNRWNSLHGCYTFLYTKFFHPKKYSIGSVGRGRLNKRLIAHNQQARVEVDRSSAGAELRRGVTAAKPMSTLPQAQLRRGLERGETATYAYAKPAPTQRPLYSNLTNKTRVILKTDKDKKVNRLPTLTPEDIFMALDVLIRFHYGEGVLDDIDHLKNRRVRLPGELMQNQLRLALSRMTQASVDKLTNVAGTSLQTEGVDESSSVAVSPQSRGEPRATQRRNFDSEAANASEGQLRSAKPLRPRPGVELSALGAISPHNKRGRGEPRATQRQAFANRLHPASPRSKVENTSSPETTLESNKLTGDYSGKLHGPLAARVSFAACIQTQVFSSTFKELFNTSQLSQYMDQTNPLAEITHKRRLSSLGPGGIAKDQAGVAVREIHPSHFGRICPIETPEGQNAGLVGSLATYCQLTSEGFLEAIYSRKPLKQHEVISAAKVGGKPVVSLAPNYQRPDWFIFQADSEDEVFISAEQYRLIPGNVEESVQSEGKGKGEANATWQGKVTANLPHVSTPGPDNALLTPINLHTSYKPKYTPIRYRQEFFRVNEALVEFFGVSPIQMISLATSLIPFLEHDDANRALMGSNMQRQAVPLMTTERAFVGTGLEVQAARDSTTLSCTQISGKVSWIDTNHVVLQGDGYLARAQPTPIPEQGRSPRYQSRGEAHAQASQSGATLTPTLANSHKNAQYHQSQWEYDLQKYWRSNQNTCIYQKPNYQHGAWIEKGRCIADGAASSYGEIALGKNIFVAYMPWEGFNFEDAIVINQRLVDEDIYTSIHIERYDIDVMDTEYGREILGRDLLNPRESQGIDQSKSYSIERGEAGRGLLNDLGVGAAPQRRSLRKADLPYAVDEGQSPRASRERSSDSTSRGEAYAGLKEASPQPLQGKGETANLDSRGIIFPGTWVEEDDILVGKMTPIAPPKPTPEYRLLLAIFETKPLPFRDTSLRVPPGIQGRILECIVKYEPLRVRNELAGSYAQQGQLRSAKPLRPRTGEGWGNFGSEGPTYNQQKTSHTRGEILSSRLVESVQVFLVSKRKIQLGDKMSGRHGNKGIVSCILPPQDMPFVQDGSPLDIVLNPLGVPSRMNVGQVLECLFGFASKMLCQNYRLIPFDEIYGEEASRGLVYTKLFEASKISGYEWIFDPNHPGKTHIFDGRTGEAFHQPVLVGYSYMLKLIHQVDEKMHARSTGPYSLITQQPLGGRAKHGGQRLGEMEVWACEGFGASAVLHEFLTLKSDDIDSRNTFLFHVMKRKSLGRAPEQRFHNKLTDKIDSRLRLGSPARRGEAHGQGHIQASYGSGTEAELRSREVRGRKGFAERSCQSVAAPIPNQVSQPTTVPESFRVLVHELQSLCLSVYFHPEFRLTYPSLLGWDGLFVLPSQSSSR